MRQTTFQIQEVHSQSQINKVKKAVAHQYEEQQSIITIYVPIENTLALLFKRARGKNNEMPLEGFWRFYIILEDGKTT